MTMDDLRTRLRHHSDSFGEPGYALRDLEVLKARRDASHRFAATVVAFGVVGLTATLLWGAFDGSRLGNTGDGPSGVENGRISFIVGELGGNMEGIHLATAEPDGSDPHTLVEGIPEYLTGGWSPDGTTIVVSRAPEASPDGHVHLWRINADGSGLEQLTDGDADDFDAQWSPDGTTILFLRTPDGRRQGTGGIEFFEAPAIFVMHADGSGVRRLSDDPDQIVLGARWSPDGAEILFIADTPADDGRDGLGIYVVRSDGTGTRRIHSGVNGTPQWSPDGRRILFQVDGRLVTMSPDGADLQTIAHGLELSGLSSYRWAPDGSRILYTRPIGPESGEQLWVVSVDGSTNGVVAEGLQWRDPASTWSPDGRFIAFVRGGDIWTVDVETGVEQHVTDTPLYESLPAWSAG
jgi:Tol biopolymer transport system component